MKPTTPLNQAADPRQPLRKLSNPQIGQATDRPSSTPVSFFLARGRDFEISNEPSSPPRKRSPSVQTLQDTIEEAAQPLSRKVSPSVDHDGLDPRRRSSTIKARSPHISRRGSSIHSNTPSLTREEASLPASLSPSALPSQEPSLPSSPETRSSLSLPQSRASSNADDNSSQAVVSSEDDGPELASAVQNSAPQLIMPSIKMPSRRPFTQRGKTMGRCKIMVAGASGSGKTSLIKSIVQVCEDIVHVDPLASSNPSSSTVTGSRQSATEIHASTKPYPAWWSDVDESKILRRRKSMGDAVLERNVCFVEIGSVEKGARVIRYLEQQLQRAIIACTSSSNDFIGMLSGRGGAQVDVVLYLVSSDTLEADCERIRQLSDIANVVPVLNKADLLSPEEIQSLKSRCQQLPTALPKLPVFSSPEQSKLDASCVSLGSATYPYTASCIPGPDTETMDASLLMSPEYVQPLHQSELSLLISELFEPTVLSFLRHTAAKKLITWQATHPRLSTRSSSPGSPRFHLTDSPELTSMSNSGILIPGTSPSLSSLDPSTSYALARVADHTQREERFAQIRLSKWAEELQMSLARERERYEKIARGERAIWLVERMGEEVTSGHVDAKALVKRDEWTSARVMPNQHDPLGILNFQETMRTRGWLAFQVVGSMGVFGGLVVWFVRNVNWNTWSEWIENWKG